LYRVNNFRRREILDGCIYNSASHAAGTVGPTAVFSIVMYVEHVFVKLFSLLPT
jgi:hypothetical protein